MEKQIIVWIVAIRDVLRSSPFNPEVKAKNDINQGRQGKVP